MLKFSLLGSGSSGNAAFITSPHTKILIDSGLSFRRLLARVESIGESLEGLQAVFITHEHGDHINCLGTLARKYNVPVYLTEKTHQSFPSRIRDLPRTEYFEPGDTIIVGDLTINSFSVNHDAVDPVCFTVTSAGAKVGFATDLGYCTNLVRARLSGCNALVVEANYCPEMLRMGLYPPAVRERIGSRNGHLSNQSMASLLKDVMHDDLQTVVLIHISENNNTPERVEFMARGVMRDHPAAVYLATQDGPTQLFEVVV